MAKSDATVGQRLDRAVDTLESKAQDLLHQLRDEGRRASSAAETKAQEHLWTTIAVTLGIGLVLGLILGLTRR